MQENWLAAYALGAGYATPKSRDAVATLVRAASGERWLLDRALHAVVQLPDVEDDHRLEAVWLLQRAFAEVAERS